MRYHFSCPNRITISVLLLALTFGLSQFANAQAQTPAASTGDCCWIDTKTGKFVPTVPLSGINLGGSTVEGAGAAQMEGYDPHADHAFNPKTGQNFVRVPCPPPSTATTPTPEPPKVSLLPPGWSPGRLYRR